MSVSKKWTSNPTNIQLTLDTARANPTMLLEALATQLETTYHNVNWILRTYLPPEEFKAQKALRYSISKEGEKNPMKGLTQELCPHWKGEISDGRGYLTILINGDRQFVHRHVMAQALGLEKLPEMWDVHHIDENLFNNSLDNLALVTNAGHRRIHSLMVMNQEEKSRRSTIADLYRSGTSQ
jgi:hypothetical protein